MRSRARAALSWSISPRATPRRSIWPRSARRVAKNWSQPTCRVFVGGGCGGDAVQQAHGGRIGRIDGGAQEISQVPAQRSGVGERDGLLSPLGEGVEDDFGLGVPPAVEGLFADVGSLGDRRKSTAPATTARPRRPHLPIPARVRESTTPFNLRLPGLLLTRR